ncbi:growth inhibitor PemK [Niveispirillum sp. KHB5.9]|uniref:growth inhibitor PemK n=1 Tax=Niveispirillum sp. KHB5.9 TaxID=3400269 RepID=UPI003A843713
MALPQPENGLVLSYTYLWRHEAAAGLTEGRKNRPAAILLCVNRMDAVAPQVTVAPITHSPPQDPAAAVEIPPSVKAHLGLDYERSWVVLDDLNVFTWPGFDLAPVPGHPDRFAYGLLPPAFYRRLIEQFAQLRRERRIAVQTRAD